MDAQKIHELKTDAAVFDAVARGVKTHEIRFNDRAFAVGDLLHLRETAASGEQMRAGAALVFTGRTVLRQVAHIQTGYGLTDGWCILSFALPVGGHAAHDALAELYFYPATRDAMTPAQFDRARVILTLPRPDGTMTPEQAAANHRALVAAYQEGKSMPAMSRSTGMRCVTCCARAGEPHLQSCPERP
jgi:hypothetical protein